MSTNPGGEVTAEIAADDFSAEELSQIENMRSSTPMPTGDSEQAPADAKPTVPPEEAAKPEDDIELEEGEEELEIKDGKPRDTKTGQFVSKSALLREKGRYKETRDQLAQTKEQLAVGNARLQQLMEIINSAPDEPAKAEERNPLEEPDIPLATDPLGALEQQKARTAYLAKQLASQSKSTNEARAAQAEREREIAIVNAYKSDVSAFYAKEPAFKDAWSHVHKLWHDQLEALGVTDPAGRDTMIAQQERSIINESFKHRRSPAEAIWKLAIASGFKKAAPEGELSPAAKKLAEVQRGQNASKSLSSAGGGAPAEGITLESIADMPEDQFNAFASTVAGQKKLREAGFLV